MKLVYITNVMNQTTGLERMISVQTSFFIKHYNYDIEIILLKQPKGDKTVFFDFDKSIKRHYLEILGHGIHRFISKIKVLNKTLNAINAEIIVVCVDDIFGLFLPYFVYKKYKFVYQRHTTRNLNLSTSPPYLKTKLWNIAKMILVRLGGTSYDKFVILSDDHRQDWKHLRNIEVIENPLIINPNGLFATLDTKIILAVGRHDTVKGFDMLLKIWKEIQGKHPDWKLKIIGKKVSHLDLRQMAKNLGVFNTIEFLDHSKNMKDQYLSASIFVCTSRIEGFPLVIVEAMSFGVPVVSFDCPYGPKAIINDNEDGVLVKPNDTEIFEQSLLKLIEDNTYRKQLGSRAKTNIQRLKPEYIMPLWKNLFEDVMINKS